MCLWGCECVGWGGLCGGVCVGGVDLKQQGSSNKRVPCLP